MSFQKATKKGTFARIALLGPAGSGKTFTALRLAHQLAAGKPIAVLDTERGTASKYAGDPNPDGGVFDFLVMDDMQNFNPKVYINAIRLAEAAGVGVLIIDSLSHAWSGPGGILEFVDTKKSQNNSGNGFSAWRDATPLHNQLVDALIGARLHLITTMRTKMEYVQEKDEKGRTTVRKVGMQPVQREGVEYEFDVIVDLDQAGASISKSRCSALANKRFHEPGADLAKPLMAWLAAGGSVVATTPVPSSASTTTTATTTTPAPTSAAQPNAASPVTPETLHELLETLHQRVLSWPGHEAVDLEVVATAARCLTPKNVALADLTEGIARRMLAALAERTDEQMRSKLLGPLADAGAIPF